jgi:antitoxin ParD1/3/4
MNISFTEKQEKYIKSQVESGEFQNASEVVRNALRMHEAYEHRMITELRAEIQKGIDSEDSPYSVLDIVKEQRAKYGKK